MLKFRGRLMLDPPRGAMLTFAVTLITMKVRTATAVFSEDAIMTVANDPQFDQDPDRLSWTDVDECGLQPAEASEPSDE